MPPTDKAQVFGPLAQLVEQLAFNQLVAGSNPARPTISLFLYQVLGEFDAGVSALLVSGFCVSHLPPR